jgi:hypothetical protein
MIEATDSQAREQVTTLMDRAVVRRISVQRSPHPTHPMQHRLNHQRLTLAAIDDLIARVWISSRWRMRWAMPRWPPQCCPSIGSIGRTLRLASQQSAEPFAIEKIQEFQRWTTSEASPQTDESWGGVWR